MLGRSGAAGSSGRDGLAGFSRRDATGRQRRLPASAPRLLMFTYELHHSFAYDPAPLTAADEIIGSLPVLPLPEARAAVFGALMRDLRQELGRADIQRHAVDCMIAATALDRGAVLVTNDAL